jgi:hypothetical protein
MESLGSLSLLFRMLQHDDGIRELETQIDRCVRSKFVVEMDTVRGFVYAVIARRAYSDRGVRNVDLDRSMCLLRRLDLDLHREARVREADSIEVCATPEVFLYCMMWTVVLVRQKSPNHGVAHLSLPRPRAVERILADVPLCMSVSFARLGSLFSPTSPTRWMDLMVGSPSSQQPSQFLTVNSSHVLRVERLLRAAVRGTGNIL